MSEPELDQAAEPRTPGPGGAGEDIPEPDAGVRDRTEPEAAAQDRAASEAPDVPPPERAGTETADVVAGPPSAPPEETGEPIELAEEEPSELADDAALDAALEALLLVVDSPATDESLASALREPVERVGAALRRISGSYTEARRGIDLRRTGEGWRFYTRDVYAPYVERFLTDGQRAKLTRAALETLAVISYRQPVTRSRVAAVRGVNVDGVVRTLLTRGLIQEAGTDEETQGTLYRTTELFLERLGLSSLEELPPLAPLLPEVDAIDEL